jgi:catechol 2,3-dioxygenase-like lactoylglutathione lyase family enzyme
MVLCLALGIGIKGEPRRPKIVRIEVVELYASNEAASQQFYRGLLPLMGDCEYCKMPSILGALLPSAQYIRLVFASGNASSRLESITFEIDDEQAMRDYLRAKAIPFTERRPMMFSEEDNYLAVVDPEGHQILFAGPAFLKNKTHPNLRLIHAGFVVKDREAMDKFYRDVLGFHVYWHGGMKDGETDWVDMQVPDGTDWIEYMLNVPANADKHTLGVMNHIALGVPDVRAAAEQLKKNGVKLTEEPKIGRDGKWQLNLYDPDQTRVELMEFTPAEKPCCAEYTGAHPKP